MKYIPLINLNNGFSEIVPGGKKVVTLMEISNYYGVDVDEIYKVLCECKFNTSDSKFVEYITRLEVYRGRCIKASETFELLPYNSLTNNFFEAGVQYKKLFDIAIIEKVPY